jgi:epidermal growth factor receptor substrate 15
MCSTELPSSPATITAGSSEAQKASTVDDIFGAAHDATEPSTNKPVPSLPPAQGSASHDDLDDDFEGLEDAKEGSADDDFANISRSGLDDFNPVFDSSPPGSQTKSESTAFGNESSFDFIPSNSSTGAPVPSSGNQQKGAVDNHDWDAIFAGLDSPSTSAAPGANEAGEHEAPAAPPKTEPVVPARPSGPGRALTEAGEHDDPILKNLTGMGYSRADAVSALEKYDYNLERVSGISLSRGYLTS